MGCEIHTSYDAAEVIPGRTGEDLSAKTGGDGSDSASVCAIDYL